MCVGAAGRGGDGDGAGEVGDVAEGGVEVEMGDGLPQWAEWGISPTPSPIHT